MQLSQIQKAMGTILLEKEGLGILNAVPQWDAFLKTEQGSVVQGISRERLQLYEELLFASVEDTLGSLYPHTKRFLEKDWYKLIENYRRVYPNRSYQLYKVAEDFPRFVSEQKAYTRQYPYLEDIAHYEWLEMEVLNAEDEPLPDSMEAGFPQTTEGLEYWGPIANPIKRLRTFQYEVPQLLEQLKDLEEKPLKKINFKKGAVAILIYRDMETCQARFFQMAPLTAQFIQQLKPGRTYLEIFTALREENPALQALALEQILPQGLNLIHQCFEANIILGSVLLQSPE